MSRFDANFLEFRYNFPDLMPVLGLTFVHGCEVFLITAVNYCGSQFL